MTSVGVRQHTQDVLGCPCVTVCVRVCPSAHTGRMWLSISTHISTLVLGLSTLTLPVDCLGDFGPCGLSVKYTQDVCGCPSAHTGRPCVSVSTHRTSVAVRGCPSAHTGHLWVSVSTHKTSMAVRVCPSAHTGRLWLSISTLICMLVLGLSTLTLPVDCSGDFSPRGLFVQYTQDVCGCPPAHTGRLWLSVCVRVCLSANTGLPWLSISTHISTLVLGLSTLTLPVDCSGDFSPLGLSVQYTQDVCWCPPAHTGRLWLTHISTLVLGLSTLTLPVECLGDFGLCGPSVKYIQDVCGCPSAHTGRPCVSVSTHRTSVAVRGCPSEHTGRLWVSVSTHKTSVAVRVCPSAHTGHLWLSISTHICMLVLGLSTLTLPVDCSGDFSPHGLSVQYTHDVCGCPPAHTGRPWLSVCVRVCLSGHTGRLWLSISIHISTFVHRLNTLALPVDCLGDFGPRRLSVQYTQDVHG
ncbi:hypothetical protein YC2023_108592 [Brassica napus]